MKEVNIKDYSTKPLRHKHSTGFAPSIFENTKTFFCQTLHF